MTAQQPPYVLSSASISHDAEQFRRMIGTFAGNRSGVFAAADMAVTQRAAGANMSVDVAGGRAIIAGSEATYQGSYWAENRGVRNVTIAAADATNPRRDLIVARVRDSAYSGASNDWDIIAVTGTPAASPVDPTAPANSILLARVAVAALASSIVNANITSLRTVGVMAPPPPQVYVGQISNGTATGLTAFLTQNNILTAPYPLTMVVHVVGDAASNGAANTVVTTIADEVGNVIVPPGGLIGTSQQATFKNFNIDERKMWSLTATKTYTTGATCGFRVLYAVTGSNIYLGVQAVVTFHPIGG